MEAYSGHVYTARNSPADRSAPRARGIDPAIAKRTEDKQRRVQAAMALRIANRINESWEADTSGDPFRAGCDLLKLRLLCVREAHEVFYLHRVDSALNGIIEGLRMFKVITPEQWRGLIALRNNAYELRLAELQK